MDKKSLYEMDLNGFYQYIVQYCLDLTIPQQIDTTTTTAKRMLPGLWNQR